MKKIALTVLAVSIISLCTGIVIAQPNGLQNILTPPVDPLIKDTTLGTVIVGEGISPSIIYPDAYPYYYGGFLENFVQIMVNADEAQYVDLSISTVGGVTTITAAKVDVESSYAEVNATNIKIVIDKNVGTATFTAPHLDYRMDETSFSGDNVSFTHTFYAKYAMMVEGSGVSRMP